MHAFSIRVERFIVSVGVRLPTSMRRSLAETLRSIGDVVKRTEDFVKRERVPHFWHDVRQIFVQSARHVDEQVPCPSCGEATPAGNLTRFKRCLNCCMEDRT